MRDASPQLREVLDRGGYAIWWAADLLYDGQRRAQDLRLLNPSFRWDGRAQIQASGSAHVLSSDLHGRGIVPRQIGDTFSPFGAELQVDVIVSLDGFQARIPMGRFVLDAVPAAREVAIPREGPGLPIVTESGVELTLKDYFLRISRDRFPFPTPPDSTSMWGEIQSLTGLPVIRNLPDRTIPTSVTYDEDRLQALGDLFALADAWPHLTPTGQVTARLKEWGSPVDEFRGVASAPRVMESERVYNRVVVEGKEPDGDVIRAMAEVGEGFLRVRNRDGGRSPFGVQTYFFQSDFLQTQQQCQDTADAMLPRLARLRSVTRTVVEPLMPLREVGDVVLLEGEPTRIAEIRHQGARTTSVAEVTRE